MPAEIRSLTQTTDRWQQMSMFSALTYFVLHSGCSLLRSSILSHQTRFIKSDYKVMSKVTGTTNPAVGLAEAWVGNIILISLLRMRIYWDSFYIDHVSIDGVKEFCALKRLFNNACRPRPISKTMDVHQLLSKTNLSRPNGLSQGPVHRRKLGQVWGTRAPQFWGTGIKNVRLSFCIFN